MGARDTVAMKKVRLGCGSAFWGDMLEPAVRLVERADVDYVGFDRLAELTLSILQRARAKDPAKGYIPDIVPWMEAILPAARRRGVKIITNAGGANPEQAAEEVARVARSHGMRGMKIGVVLGDDVGPRLEALRAAGMTFPNLDSGEADLDRIADRIVAANAYLGSDAIVDALADGADVVVTGRVSDNALFVAPVAHELGWDLGSVDADLVASAIAMGHVIECAECCTGGMSNLWRCVPEPWNIGFPVAEFCEDGETVITKPPGTGGLVCEWTIKEHLVYEVIDPRNYVMPDGIADFTSVTVEEVGEDRVRISPARGKPRPRDLKLCIGFEDGFIGEAQIFFPWPDALDKARRAADIIAERFRIVRLDADEVRCDLLGVNALLGDAAPAPAPGAQPGEVGLRVAARTRSRSEADKVRREVTHLWTISSLGAHIGVPVRPRPVLSLWPTLIPRAEVPARHLIKEA